MICIWKIYILQSRLSYFIFIFTLILKSYINLAIFLLFFLPGRRSWVSGEITTHFGVVKDAGHELSQKIATLHTYFQLSQTTIGAYIFFEVAYFVIFYHFTRFFLKSSSTEFENKTNSPKIAEFKFGYFKKDLATSWRPPLVTTELVDMKINCRKSLAKKNK